MNDTGGTDNRVTRAVYNVLAVAKNTASGRSRTWTSAIAGSSAVPIRHRQQFSQHSWVTALSNMIILPEFTILASTPCDLTGPVSPSPVIYLESPFVRSLSSSFFFSLRSSTDPKCCVSENALAHREEYFRMIGVAANCIIDFLIAGNQLNAREFVVRSYCGRARVCTSERAHTTVMQISLRY